MKKKIYTIASYNHAGIGGPAYLVAMGADPNMSEIREMLPQHEVDGFYLEIVKVENSPNTAAGVLAIGKTCVHVTRFADWIECVF